MLCLTPVTGDKQAAGTLSFSRLLKKAHMPPACRKQAFRIVALDRCGNYSRSKRSRSNVPPKYASARRFFARLVSEIFLTSLQTAFFSSLLDSSRQDTIPCLRNEKASAP